MRYYRKKSEPMEGGQFASVEKKTYSVSAQEKWRRDGLSCMFHKFRVHLSELITSTKDLGNTNYSIHVPRASFDRRVTAQIVVRALQSLELDAETNDRNDICVSNYKMSVPIIHISHCVLKLRRAYTSQVQPTK